MLSKVLVHHHLAKGFCSELAVFQTVCSFCAVVSATEGFLVALRNNISFIFCISRCTWELPSPVRELWQRGEGRQFQDHDTDPLKIQLRIYRKPVACKGGQLWVLHMRFSFGRWMNVTTAAWFQSWGCPSPPIQLSYPLPASVFSGYGCFWAHLLILTMGKLPWEHHFLVDLPLS